MKLSQIVTWFEMAGLRQYPPRRRTLMVQIVETIRDEQNNPTAISKKEVPAQFNFPWMTFGGLILTDKNAPCHRKYYLPLCYFHERPWKDLQDAAEIVRLPPAGLHSEGYYGKVCLGKLANEIAFGSMTVEEGYWGTRNRTYAETLRHLPGWIENPKHWLHPTFPTSLLTEYHLATLGRRP